LEAFSLDLKTALGTARWPGGEAAVFCSAVAPVIMMRFTGKSPRVIRKPAEFWKLGEDVAGASVTKASLGRLGYGRPRLGRQKDIQYVRQVCAQGFEYAVVFSSRVKRGSTELAIAICT